VAEVDLEAIRARAEAATPGPWQHVDYADPEGQPLTGDGQRSTFMGCGSVITMAERVMGGDICAPNGDLYPRSGYSPDADMAFIAAARSDIPALLAKVADAQEANSDLAADVHRLEREVESLRRQVAEARERILDIDAHATPYGDLPDEPGWVGTYLVTAGALHRALGKIGHSAPSCSAEAERDDWAERYGRAVAKFDRAQVEIAELKRARAAERDVIEAAKELAGMVEMIASANPGAHHHPLVHKVAAAVDALASQPVAPAQCCDLHGRNCEPPSELCCWSCTEAGHPEHRDGSTCSAPDLSRPQPVAEEVDG
jgi:cell division septum initiation protein DivIVA